MAQRNPRPVLPSKIRSLYDRFEASITGRPRDARSRRPVVAVAPTAKDVAAEPVEKLEEVAPREPSVRRERVSDGTKAAVEQFRALCRDPLADEAAVALAAQGLPARTAGAVLDELVAGPPAGGAAAALVAARLLDGKRRHQRALDLFLITLSGRAEATVFQARLAAELAVVWAERGEAAPIRRLVQKVGRAVKRDTYAWGRIGFALLRADCGSTLLHWSKDWRERRDVEGWMLMNVAGGRRAVDAWDEVRDIHRHALDSCADFRQAHAAWLAVVSQLEHDPEEAARARAVAAVADETRAERFARFPLTLLEVMDAPEPKAAREALYRAANQPAAQGQAIDRVIEHLSDRHGKPASYFRRGLPRPDAMPSPIRVPKHRWGLWIAGLAAVILLNALSRCWG